MSLLLKECSRCGTPFVPASFNQIYCCYACKRKSCDEKRKQRNVDNKNRRKTIPLADGVPSIKDVVRMTIEHNRETGRIISYGKMVAIMERGDV